MADRKQIERLSRATLSFFAALWLGFTAQSMKFSQGKNLGQEIGRGTAERMGTLRKVAEDSTKLAESRSIRRNAIVREIERTLNENQNLIESHQGLQELRTFFEEANRLILEAENFHRQNKFDLAVDKIRNADEKYAQAFNLFAEIFREDELLRRNLFSVLREETIQDIERIIQDEKKLEALREERYQNLLSGLDSNRENIGEQERKSKSKMPFVMLLSSFGLIGYGTRELLEFQKRKKSKPKKGNAKPKHKSRY